MKRAFDIACACIAFLLFTGPLGIVALLVYTEDRGPVFFLQERAGRRRKPIRVFKFRTMQDGRVTRVGRWLRAAGIDEIPQFINVLTGDISVVGPRPLTEDDIVRLGWGTPRFVTRWEVRPGITGLAQLYGGHGAGVSWFLDRRYLQIQSLPLDSTIVFLSFVVNIIGKPRVRSCLGWLKRKSRQRVKVSPT